PNNLSALYYIHQSRYPPSQDINAIKQIVLDSGAVWSLLYYNSTYLDPGDDTYYYGGTHEVNHAGCVVGWDDNMLTAGGTGAWIVRNTYGAGWADNGYYYISYSDSQFLKYNGFWPEFLENEANSTIYQYDEIGGYWGVGGWNEIAYGLVAFDGPPYDMEISKIGTFVIYAGCDIEIKIYDNFSGSLSGLLGSRDEELLDLPGYYTFNLDSAILIPAGNDFYVQIKYDSNDPSLKWPVAIEDTINGYSMPVIETGRFWISDDPVTIPTDWYQIGHTTNFHYDLCIKAYTTKITAPRVATGTIANVYTNHAEISTNQIESNGDAPVTQKGICWNLTGNPDINDNITDNGTGNDSYNSLAIELQASTDYYVKAYATNSSGTRYGKELSFTSPSCDAEITVINNSDNGYGSLREAIANSCENCNIIISGDIDGQSIDLTSGALSINKSISIDNSSHSSGLSISSGGQAIDITSGNSLSLAPQSKVTVSGSIQNNAGNGGLIIQSSDDGTASLIHNTSEVPATVQRYIAGTDAWHHIAVPISSATANVFQGDYLQYYTEAIATWTDVVDPGHNLNVAQGYALWGTSGTSTLYTFTGNLNNGNLTISTTQNYEDPGDQQFYGWTLLGNPYPSSINWALLDDDWGAIYYWDQTNSHYASWVNGAGTNGGTQYLPPMQGFFVSSTGADFEISNSHRVHNGASSYFKNEQTDHIILQAKNNAYSDEVYIAFNKIATTGFDRKHDAWKLLSFNEEIGQLYSFAADKMLSVDIRPTCKIVQLGFRSEKNAAFSFILKEISDISEIIIEDTKTNTMHNFAEGVYNFDYFTSDKEKRFLLHFVVEEQGVEDEIDIYSNSQTIYISSEKVIEDARLTISDLIGRVLLLQELKGSDYFVIPINISTGIYVVSIQTLEENISEKVFIK
ncbi:MAG: lectin like domain-containing protein, partial [Bacteroidota bacterium]|nr:lectin like domain-containing protein [Bacteroidota bacterium]